MQLAVQHKQHIDIVIWYRNRYLESIGQKETIQDFIEYNQQLDVTDEVIKKRIQEERKREALKPGIKPYT